MRASLDQRGDCRFASAQTQVDAGQSHEKFDNAALTSSSFLRIAQRDAQTIAFAP